MTALARIPVPRGARGRGAFRPTEASKGRGPVCPLNVETDQTDWVL